MKGTFAGLVFVAVMITVSPYAYAQFDIPGVIKWHPVEDVPREGQKVVKAGEEAAKHVTSEAQKELEKAKKVATDVGVPSVVVEVVTSHPTGVVEGLNKIAHGEAPSAKSITDMIHPSATPGLIVGAAQATVSGVTAFVDKVGNALDAAAGAAKQAEKTGKTADDLLTQFSTYLKAFAETLTGAAGIMVPLTLIVWGAALLVAIAVLRRVAGFIVWITSPFRRKKSSADMRPMRARAA